MKEDIQKLIEEHSIKCEKTFRHTSYISGWNVCDCNSFWKYQGNENCCGYAFKHYQVGQLGFYTLQSLQSTSLNNMPETIIYFFDQIDTSSKIVVKLNEYFSISSIEEGRLLLERLLKLKSFG